MGVNRYGVSCDISYSFLANRFLYTTAFSYLLYIIVPFIFNRILCYKQRNPYSHRDFLNRKYICYKWNVEASLEQKECTRPKQSRPNQDLENSYTGIQFNYLRVIIKVIDKKTCLFFTKPSKFLLSIYYKIIQTCSVSRNVCSYRFSLSLYFELDYITIRFHSL